VLSPPQVDDRRNEMDKLFSEVGVFEIPTKYQEEYMKLTPEELWKRLIASIKFKQDADGTIYGQNSNLSDAEFIPKWLYNNYFIEVGEECLQRFYENDVTKLKEELDELKQQFKQHRHNLDKTYSEKPTW